jgi:hypothetical protein
MSEVARLRERIEELEDLLGLTETVPTTVFTGHHRARLEMVAKLLLARELVSKTAIILAIGGADRSEATAAVYVSYLRKQLAERDIELRTEWGRGWRLDVANKAKLRALIASKQLAICQRPEGER